MQDNEIVSSIYGGLGIGQIFCSVQTIALYLVIVNNPSITRVF